MKKLVEAGKMERRMKSKYFQAAKIAEWCYCEKHNKIFYGIYSSCCPSAKYMTGREEKIFLETRRITNPRGLKREESVHGEQGFQRFQNVRRVEELKGRPDIPEPLIRGGSNGVPCRVDRTRALGNAVVPQCAQFVARLIKERENS